MRAVLFGAIVSILLVVIVHLPPSNSIRYRGHYYRTPHPENLPELASLRDTATRVVAGIPWSVRRRVTLWRLGRCVFVERPPDGDYLAVTIDKGREMEICLDYTDVNALHYVLVHELAHMHSWSVGHTAEFHRNMSRLLESAKAQGFYSDDARRVVFCGSHIDLDT